MKPRNPIRRISARQSKRLAEYRQAKAEYMAKHKFCGVCCSQIAIDIHHLFGRGGKLLCDQTRFLAVCRSCHIKIHQNPKWAVENGYLPPMGKWNNV
jgi:hypothetical protein